MKINRNILLIANCADWAKEHPAFVALENLDKALTGLGLDVHFAWSIENAITQMSESPKYSAVGIYLDDGNINMAQEALRLVNRIRTISETLPVFALTCKDLIASLPVELIREVKEYIYLFSETPEFTAKRLFTAIFQYNQQLLPPYFRQLKNFTEDGDYYWDCPGHMGGMAYLKHPVGVEFFDFFGENMFRADIGVATSEMGDYLIHAGPVRQSEQNAAKLFGADWTFFTVAGSSGSNRIVAQGAVGANEITVVDRNCHKSLNHGLTLSGARPVYMKPTRNGYGLIGPIPASRMSAEGIRKQIAESPLAKGAVSPLPSYAVVTNCTYDGFCYNVTKVVDALKESVPRIHFDEAWYAYAKFHPLYRERFAMGVSAQIKNMPTIFAVQSTHKMLPALSMASMIHVRRSERAPLDFDDFNDAFMMHGTTSPYYPILASIDVAVAMMQGQSGAFLVQESIEDAIAFRKAVVGIKRKILEKNPRDWFFDVLQPDTVKDPKTGAQFSFQEAPISLLSSEPSCWALNPDEQWHGFAKEEIENTDCMLDPVKVTLTCPGITPDGTYQENGIPGYIMTKFLDERRTEIARTGDYTLLILFSVGTTKGKWGNLIESLLEFKRLYDEDAPVSEAIASLAETSPQYADMTLRELCSSMHGTMRELGLIDLLAEAANTDPEPVYSPAEAYQKVVRYKTEHVRLKDYPSRIAAGMLVPYPPGIPLLMPGERIAADDKGILGYLEALQSFDKKFPGFEHEIQGVNVDGNGDFWVRVICEDDTKTERKKSHFKPRKVSGAIKKGRM
ncbi:MAG: Orn/Lys/Arg decarboxylase N-terminal domain-containing protein [Victivallaceae bacterium]|nr:Orn/Lys/Arg decarboxylase N-terminal domain-containing protein [Victivallaceae bacterium]